MLISLAATAQTLNIKVGNILYQYPASQAGKMTFSGGKTLTVKGTVFNIADIDTMYIDNAAVTDSQVGVVYSGTTVAITVAGNIARYLTIAQSGAHVSMTQSSDLADEITYNLSGSSTDGEFYTEGSYKATLQLNGLTLTNATPVYSGAAIHVQNSKRINVKLTEGTVSTLTDAASGSQKGCLYVKGHIEFKQKGTLNVYGKVKHGIKAGEYVSIKNATVNVLQAAGDGLNCEQYFLMESGTLNISGTTDDGIQCDIEDTDTGSTGTTTDHEDEDSGNMYLQGGTITVNVSGTAAKGIKAEGDIAITGGTINVTTTGGGEWDTDDLETKAACGISSDTNITISGGAITLSSSGSGGKGMKCDGTLTISDGTIDISTTGGLYYNNGSSEYTNYTGNTDNIDSDYYSSAKGIKAGTKTEVRSQYGKTTYSYAGGIIISGGTITVKTTGYNAEGIESKATMEISGGEIIADTYDDALNAASDLTISGGMVYAYAKKNDAIDSNGNCYIKGGLIYAIGASGAEVAIDANSEDQKTLYVSGGTLVAIGGLERGASLTQSCYSISTWSPNTWYVLTVGSDVFAFKTPASGGNTLVVSGVSTPTLKSGVTASGTSIFGGAGYYPATYSGGSSINLSNYSGGNQGGGPGGWGGQGGWGRP